MDYTTFYEAVEKTYNDDGVFFEVEVKYVFKDVEFETTAVTRTATEAQTKLRELRQRFRDTLKAPDGVSVN